MINYVGWDLSIKNSGITLIVPDTESGFRVLARWGRGPKTVNLAAVTKFFNSAVPNKVFADLEPSVVAIDWTTAEAHMRGNKIFTTTKSYVAGLIYSRLCDLGHYPVFIPPKMVRNYFALSSNAKKDAVVNAFVSEWRHEGFSVEPLNHLNEHTLDALILAYVAHDQVPEIQAQSATEGVVLEITSDF